MIGVAGMWHNQLCMLGATIAQEQGEAKEEAAQRTKYKKKS